MRFLSMVVLTISVFAHMASAAESERAITVTGTAQIAAEPDMATINLGVTTQGRTAAAAVSANSDAMAKVLAKLSAAGIEDRDIQTSNFNVQPQWDQQRLSSGQRQIVGFWASNQLAVRVRDLDALGGVLDSVIEEGANTFNGLSFGLQEPEPLRDAARKDAVADARRKAELLAEAAGVTLGPLMSLTEFGGGGAPQPMARMEMAMADSVPIAAGEVGITASVNLVYAIAD